MSLDGFIAGPNDGPEHPLGEGGMRLFDWYSSLFDDDLSEVAHDIEGLERSGS